MEAQELLKDLDPNAFRSVPNVPAQDMFKLAMHPDKYVRHVAIDLVPLRDLPLFIGDEDSINQIKILKRLKNGL